jgi:hypothetical protein
LLKVLVQQFSNNSIITNWRTTKISLFSLNN